MRSKKGNLWSVHAGAEVPETLLGWMSTGSMALLQYAGHYLKQTKQVNGTTKAE